MSRQIFDDVEVKSVEKAVAKIESNIPLSILFYACKAPLAVGWPFKSSGGCCLFLFLAPTALVCSALITALINAPPWVGLLLCAPMLYLFIVVTIAIDQLLKKSDARQVWQLHLAIYHNQFVVEDRTSLCSKITEIYKSAEGRDLLKVSQAAKLFAAYKACSWKAISIGSRIYRVNETREQIKGHVESLRALGEEDTRSDDSLADLARERRRLESLKAPYESSIKKIEQVLTSIEREIEIRKLKKATEQLRSQARSVIYDGGLMPQESGGEFDEVAERINQRIVTEIEEYILLEKEARRYLDV